MSYSVLIFLDLNSGIIIIIILSHSPADKEVLSLYIYIFTASMPSICIERPGTGLPNARGKEETEYVDCP